MSQYARRAGVMSVELDGETVLLDTVSGQYFRLNTTATLIWTLLERALTVEELARDVHERTEVDPEVLRADLAELLEMLEVQQLVVAS